ncbi:MAG: putative amidohydrolase YtcJ [Enterobacterales bacterium]|jgi:predicted amidohydrolase YtcJ
MQVIKLLITSALLITLLNACNPAQEKADLVFLDANVYTANKNQQTATAFALKDGAFIYVGSDTTAKSFIGPKTNVVELNGKRVLPGLHDNHIHPGGILEFERCDMEGTSLNLTELASHIKECLVRLSPAKGEWLIGEQWSFSSGNTPTEQFQTIRSALDSVSTEHPIVLSGNDGHHSAYNSTALALAKNTAGDIVGFNKNTLSTIFSEHRKLLGVDVSGEPDGMVNEQARNLMAAPNMLEGDIEKIIANASQIPERLNSIGITSIRDAYFVEASAPYYKTLSDAGKLSLRITLSQYHNPLSYADEQGAIDWPSISKEAAKIRDTYKSYKHINANSLKLFVDGVAEGNPLSTPPALPNAAAIDNYKQPIFHFDSENEKLTIKGYVDTDSKACKSDKTNVEAFIHQYSFHPDQCLVSNGVLENPRDVEMEFVRRFDSEGYDLHLHAIGDRALRTALDAFENARKLNGPAKQPHSLAHIQFVHPDDIKRIGDLKLYLAYTYAWIVTDPEYDLSVMPFMDNIVDSNDIYKNEYYSYRQAYPVKSTMLAGAILIAGSDAPVDTRDPRPFVNIQQAITRAGTSGKPYNKSEQISITDVIDAYTINGARAMNQADIVGSIEVGKLGDFIVLDQDIIELAKSNPTLIDKTKVTATWFNGELVYQAK